MNATYYYITDCGYIQNIFLAKNRIFYKTEYGGVFMVDIPVWERYTLTVEEAAAYFRIGENKLRELIAANRRADWILYNGNRAQIKRKKFEEFIDSVNYI